MILFFPAHVCPDLPEFSNGVITFSIEQISLVEFVRAATYSCEPGFELVGGNVTRLCVGDESSPIAMWTGTAPTCEGTGVSMSCRCISFSGI